MKYIRTAYFKIGLPLFYDCLNLKGFQTELKLFNVYISKKYSLAFSGFSQSKVTIKKVNEN